MALITLLATALKGRKWRVPPIWAELVAVLSAVFIVIWVLRIPTDWYHFIDIFESGFIAERQLRQLHTILILNLCTAVIVMVVWLAGFVTLRVRNAKHTGSEKTSCVVRLMPCSAWNAVALTQWLNDQAENGMYFRTAFLGIAIFASEKHDRLHYVLYGASQANTVSSGYTYVGSVGHIYSVFASEGENLQCIDAYTKRNKVLAMCFNGFLLLAAFLLVYKLRIGGNGLYIQWLLQWKTVSLVLALVLVVAIIFGILPGLFPVFRRPGRAWISWLRKVIIGISAVLIVAFSAIPYATAGKSRFEAVLSDYGGNVVYQCVAQVPFAARCEVFATLPDNTNITISEYTFQNEKIADWCASGMEQELDAALYQSIYNIDIWCDKEGQNYILKDDTSVVLATATNPTQLEEIVQTLFVEVLN